MMPCRLRIYIENEICYQWNFVWCVMIIGSVSSKIDWKPIHVIIFFPLFFDLFNGGLGYNMAHDMNVYTLH